jgi:N-sulfoglucosamine sulfohydrolase
MPDIPAPRAQCAPNLVYFHVHDLGRHLPLYGVPVDAPALSAFAAGSVVFDRAFCSSPACTPSRACALSGRHAHATGCIGLSHMGWPLDLAQSTIVDDLNAAGFQTALVGVNHERHPRTDRYAVDLTESWDDWGTGTAVDKALAFLRQRADDRPFFLNVGSQQPHASTWHQFAACADDPAAVWLPLWMDDTPQRRVDFGRFQAAIRYMDLHFGRFIDGLKALGHDRDTIVVFTTDHGISGPRSKGFLYERGLEIALMIRMPDGLGGGTRRQQLVANVDFRPTWLELLGLPVPPALDGRSFAPAIADESWPGQARIFAERNFHGEKLCASDADYTDLYDPMRSVRSPDFHLVRNYLPHVRPAEPLPLATPPPVHRPTVELYDLRHDPQEWINVANRPEYQAIRHQLEADLDAWMTATGDFLPDNPPPTRPEAPGWGPHWPPEN